MQLRILGQTKNLVEQGLLVGWFIYQQQQRNKCIKFQISDHTLPKRFGIGGRLLDRPFISKRPYRGAITAAKFPVTENPFLARFFSPGAESGPPLLPAR